MFDSLQFLLLKTLWPRVADSRGGVDCSGKSKLRMLLGEELLLSIQNKTVVDFGCGEGSEAVELARSGASRVIGLDIREEVLAVARRAAVNAGVESSCLFVTSTDEKADLIVSLDAFEHFADPAAILQIMDSLLAPGGEIIVSFGPPWLHPLGGHLFSVFPWSHLVFSERALIRWRSRFKTDGATRFSEVAGGLNQITIQRFEQIVDASPFRFTMLEAVPIRKLRAFHSRFTREFTTAVVRCRLARKT